MRKWINGLYFQVGAGLGSKVVKVEEEETRRGSRVPLTPKPASQGAPGAPTERVAETGGVGSGAMVFFAHFIIASSNREMHFFEKAPPH